VGFKRLSPAVLAGAAALAALLAAVAAGPGAAGPPSSAAAVERALANVRANAAATRFAPNQDLASRDVIVDADGTEHVRFDRTYRGLRVIGGDLVVHTARDGRFLGASHTLRTTLSVSVRPAIASDGAVTRARERFAGDAQSTASELVVYAVAEPRLAWDAVVEGMKPDETPSRLHVIVDARSGAVLDAWDEIVHATGTGHSYFSGTVGLETTPYGSGYRLTDPSRGNQFTCDMRNRQASGCYYFDDADNSWGDGTLANRQTVAVDAQYGSAVTWDYYKLQHGRNGIANDGKGAYSRVHYGRNYNNAFWSNSCFCMTYGDGDGVTYNPFDSLDVAGHEMTHGVTSRTANLTYSGESGGLNEATSDIFGTMVEYYANNSRDTADYKIGEKLYKSNPGEAKALRYMWQPSLDGKSADCWYSGVGSLDVHYSSGVGNHFYYLLAEGSSATPASPTCNGSSVTGIGQDRAGRIWYRALTVYMTSSTTYHGARTATLRAAADLYGSGSTEYYGVNAAWAAVNVT
jgi:zinc metalloprotease ZmpA